MVTNKNRSTLIGVVGGYLIYLAYDLYQNRVDPNTTMTPFMRTLFIILFVLLGIGLLVYAWRCWKSSDADDAKEEAERKDTNNFK